MEQKQTYGGLDLFRPAAALLVLAIHTSPLASFSPGADFFLTRILARIAVPFFFMVTGQFVLSSGASILRSVKKLCAIYLAAVLLYLPLGIYAGHYRELTVGGFFKMLFFDGTFYHLWYFPACVLGLLTVSLLGRFLRPGGVTAVSAVLYCLGLLGDSYYGLTAKVPLLSDCYQAMFRVFSYTRNGLFFAPLFLTLGALAGRRGMTGQGGGFRAASQPDGTTPENGQDGSFRAASQPDGMTPEDGQMPRDHRLLRGRTLGRNAAALALSFAAMTVEAFTLRHLDFQRHDSMYLFLVPVSYFLYLCLLSVPAVSRKGLRRTAAWIYLLHPAMIVVVRGAAKLLDLTGLLVENSLIHFLAVACLSVPAGALMALLQERFFSKHSSLSGSQSCRTSRQTRGSRPAKAEPPAPSGCDTDVISRLTGTERAWVELDLHALENNVRFLQSRLTRAAKTADPDAKAATPGGHMTAAISPVPTDQGNQDCRLMPTVKANAYGHGAVPIARELNRLGIYDFCVACVEEGIKLRRAGIQGEILVLGYTAPSLLPLLCRYRLTQTVADYDHARRLEENAGQEGLSLPVHIGVDTGMHRLGIPWEETEKILDVYRMEHLEVRGIFSHLAASDSLLPECRDFTEKQLQAFSAVKSAIRAAGLPCRGCHLLSSYGILHYPQAAEDYVRPGIALYGVPSSPDSSDGFESLLPVLSLKARVASVRRLRPGESAGYGQTFTAARETVIAVLSIGYADGLPRELSEQKGSALIKGRRVPIIGRICMDQTLVDATGIPDLQVGEPAVFIGTSGDLEITAAEVAAQCGTITNELLSRLGTRLHRVKK